MATKIIRFLSCSSLATCRRFQGTNCTNLSKPVVQTFNWTPLQVSPLVCSVLSPRMASSVTNEPEKEEVKVEVKVEGNDLEISSSEQILLDTATKTEETAVSSSTESTLKTEATAPVVNSSEQGAQDTRKVRKVKAAILLSYSGQGYFGMQVQNNGTRTIENDLLKAFYDAGVVDKEGLEKPKSAKFQRAARTDKNVSAARNIVSMMVPKDDFDVDAVNKLLPDQIRVMDFRRVTKGFDAKIACCARTYLYMIPTFAFAPLEVMVTEDYRITPDVLENVRKTLKLYEGTKNYHNFTSRKKPTDPSAMRFIMSFTTSEPFEKEGLEYVVLQVKGQSFMMHQIRKMIGLAVAILRGCASEETMKKAFTLDRIDIPMAPGLGLMLGETHYDHYNKKFGHDGIHEPLVWDNVADKIEAFCQEKIYTEVTKTENEEKSTFQWLATVPFHTFDVHDLKSSGYGPLGKANRHVKKVNGELSDEEDLDDDEDSDDLPRKKQRMN